MRPYRRSKARSIEKFSSFFFTHNFKNSFSADPWMKQLLWYLIAGTRGGETRGKIISFLRQEPSNANKLTSSLHLDYKTIRHHLRILEENRIILAINKGNYGAVYFLTPEFGKDYGIFEEIWNRFGKK